MLPAAFIMWDMITMWMCMCVSNKKVEIMKPLKILPFKIDYSV